MAHDGEDDTDTEKGALTRELGLALDALDASLAAHRTLESVLLAILAHAPIALVVADQYGVRAASTAAVDAWSAPTGTKLTALPEAVRAAVDAALLGLEAAVGLSTTLIEEPGTKERYVLVVSTDVPTSPTPPAAEAVPIDTTG